MKAVTLLPVTPTVVGTVFIVIFLAELPDKSLFASVVLGTRYPPLWVWAGASAAFAVHVAIAVAAGGVLTLLPHKAVEAVVCVLFGVGAFLLLRGEAAEEDAVAPAGAGVRATVPAVSSWRVMATCFGVVFAGEWGDITQLATANLAASYADPLSVAVGSALALITVSGLAVMAGKTLLRLVPLDLVRRTAGVLLAVFAVGTAVQLVP